MSDLYVYIRTSRYEGSEKYFLRIDVKNTRPGDDASTVNVATGRARRDEQCEARRRNTTPNGEPHLELGCVRLETLSKSDFSIVETTWPTYLHIHLQGSFASASRRPPWLRLFP